MSKVSFSSYPFWRMFWTTVVIIAVIAGFVVDVPQVPISLRERWGVPMSDETFWFWFTIVIGLLAIGGIWMIPICFKHKVPKVNNESPATTPSESELHSGSRPILEIDDGEVCPNPDGSQVVRVSVKNTGPMQARMMRLMITEIEPLNNKTQARQYVHQCRSSRIEHTDNDGTRDKGAKKEFILASTDASGYWEERGWIFVHCMGDDDILDRVKIPRARYRVVLTATGRPADQDEQVFVLNRTNNGTLTFKRG